MGAQELLHDLQAAGFALEVADGKLLVTPASNLTDDRRAALRACKPELLALLADNHHVVAGQRAATSVSVATPANRLTAPAPISQLATLAGVASTALPGLADAIRRCCGLRGDPPGNAQALLAECAGLSRESQADLLAHFAIEAARWPGPPAAADVRVTCRTCAHYRPGRCGNHRVAGLRSPELARDLASMLQRCDGFKP